MGKDALELGRLTVHLAHQRPDMPGYSGMPPRAHQSWMLLLLLNAHVFRCPLGMRASKSPVLIILPPGQPFAVDMRSYRHYSAHFSEETYYGWRETSARNSPVSDEQWSREPLRQNPETLRLVDTSWHLFQAVESRADILAAFDRLVASYQSKERFRAVVALLALLERSAAAKASHDGSRLRRFADHIAFHGNRPMSVAELAKDCGMSRVHLHRLCRGVYGVAPKELLLRERIAVACRSLERGASVHQAASAAGFHDVYYFSRIFARRQGGPPSRWAGRAR
jgi:AraC-like DNA-binding protein